MKLAVKQRRADMNLHDLTITPPWEWPADARRLLATLLDEKAAEADRRLAAELAGNLVVMNDELASALIHVLENGRESSEIRARAAISLGPVLEQVDTDRFDESEDLPIRPRFIEFRNPSVRRSWMRARRKKCDGERSRARCARRKQIVNGMRHYRAEQQLQREVHAAILELRAAQRLGP